MRFLATEKIKPETAAFFQAGLYCSRSFLLDCVGVRLHDTSDHPLGYAGRRLIPMQIIKYGKWKFPDNIPKNELLYNFHRIYSQILNGLVVVEDALSVRLSQLVIPAFALLGTHLSPHKYRLLYNAVWTILMLDGDEAGRKATEQLFENSNLLPAKSR